MDSDNNAATEAQPERPREDRGGDRRRRGLPLWHPWRLRGRRMKNRRAKDHDRPYLVDRIDGRAFLMAALLLMLTLADGVITVVLLDRGCEEANPLMRLLLRQGIVPFLVGKYVLTALFLPVALVLHQYRLFGTRVRVGQIVPLVVALYVVLIVYQITLWGKSQVRGPRPPEGPTVRLVRWGNES